MSPEQQVELLRVTGIGLDWAQGRISFDQVKEKLGAPARHVGGYTNAYVYFSDVATVKFVFDDHHLIDGSPAVKAFHLLVDPYLKPHIPMEDYEAKLGLHRLVQGEKIDGVRVETRKFFNPGYVQPDDFPNRVILGYRLPLRPDSLFDVYVDVEYKGKNDPPGYRSLNNPENLRSIDINRDYLTPE
jgi:hypothetical protein